MRLGHFPWHWWPAIKVEREIKGKYYLDHREYIYAHERSLHVQQIDHAHSENISCCNCRYQCFCDIGSYSICYFTSYFPLASLGLHRFQCFNITLVHNSLCVWRLPSPHFGNHVYQVTWLSASSLIPESYCATTLWCRMLHRDACSLLHFCCCSAFGSIWEEIQSLWSFEWPWRTPQEAYWVVGHAWTGYVLGE